MMKNRSDRGVRSFHILEMQFLLFAKPKLCVPQGGRTPVSSSSYSLTLLFYGYAYSSLITWKTPRYGAFSRKTAALAYYLLEETDEAALDDDTAFEDTDDDTAALEELPPACTDPCADAGELVVACICTGTTSMILSATGS